MNAKITNQEIQRITRKLRRWGATELKAAVVKELAFTAYDTVAVAKVLAPEDNGVLKNTIVPTKRKGGLNWNINSRAKYSAYQEFGTGRKVDLSDLRKSGYPESYAAQFRGRGIRAVNIKPQPFFFPAINQEWPKLIPRLKKEIEKRGRKF